MPFYILHGEDDSAALAWLGEQKSVWIPQEWLPFNAHQFDLRKASLEELQDVVQSYPMGCERRLVVLREFEKADSARKKQLAAVFGDLLSSTVVVFWLVPGAKNPKKLPFGSEWKEILKEATFIKCAPSIPQDESTVFTWLDRLGERQTPKALGILKTLLLQGEPPLRLLATLTNHIRMLWQMKFLIEEGQNASEIAKNLGVHPYRATKGLKQLKNFKVNELARFYDWLCRADFSLKSGKQEPEYLLELLVLRLCKG